MIGYDYTYKYQHTYIYIYIHIIYMYIYILSFTSTCTIENRINHAIKQPDRIMNRHSFNSRQEPQLLAEGADADRSLRSSSMGGDEGGSSRRSTCRPRLRDSGSDPEVGPKIL